LTLSLSLSVSLRLRLTLSLSRSRSRSRSLTLTLSLSLSLSVRLTLSLTLVLTVTLTLSLSLSLSRRGLHFEYLINLSDADLALRTDAELRTFFTRFYGRSVMSIVQKKKDPRRYKMHEGFRSYCWTECANGSGFFVTGGETHPAGLQPNSFDVIGKNKCCWSRTAPIIYSNATLDCPNKELPGARG